MVLFEKQTARNLRETEERESAGQALLDFLNIRDELR
jgi:hypothetical protein